MPTDVMPAFSRGHLGEADGSMSSPSFLHPPRPPSEQLSPCLIHHGGGGGYTQLLLLLAVLQIC